MSVTTRPRVAVCAACFSLCAMASPAFAQGQGIDPSKLPSTAPVMANASAPSAPSSPSSISQPPAPGLFSGIVGDFRNLASPNTALWLGVGAGLALAGHPGDTTMSRSFSNAKEMDGAFSSGKVIGGTAVQLGGALATYTVGRLAGSSTTARVGSELFRSQLVAQSVSSVLKVSVSRTRPDGASYSFPSGHSASAFASATVLQRNFGWKVGVPAYAVASYVAASRIQAKRHYFSDVAFGASIGILAGRTVTIGSREARFAVSPMAVPGGGGVSFDWVGPTR